MRDRRKRNIIIGSLCCLLVFMGIGYALLSQTLNINGMATMTGEWKIFIDSITVKETGGSAKSNTAEVSEDKMGASFDVELLKLGDYAFEEANPTTLVMSPAIKNIGTQAFRTLKISEFIPSTIEKIDIRAFGAMPSTSTITINRAEGSFTTVDPWSGGAKVVYNS